MHDELHFTGSEVVKDIVIGMSDGLTVPFALAAGLSGAVDSTAIILTAGFAEIAAGAIAMGLGGYLAGRTEIDHYQSELQREYTETEIYPERERQEVKEILATYGVSIETQNQLVSELELDKNKWVDFMMKFELGLEKPDERRATKSAMNIGLSYIVGGLIPLCPYYFIADVKQALIASVAITLVSLLVFGFFKSKATGQPPLMGALRTMFIGALAAGVAFFVAKSFSR